MKSLLTQFRSFGRPSQLLLLNQFSINIGFYMLMPYLAVHLSVTVGLAGWLVGLILGVRNFSQQGMFLLGGALADRFGYKPLIVAGCMLRTVGFAVLGFADSVPALIFGAAATGFAGALFNPAVRAYVAADAGERRVEAFALFNVFYQAVILLGPLAGLALTAVGFQLTCAVAAGVFALLTVLQLRALPPDRAAGQAAVREPVRWRELLGNKRFLAFAAAMSGSYLLLYQTYQALPLELRRLAGGDGGGALAVGIMFALSGLVAIAGQLRITSWCRARWTHGQSMTAGLALMGAAFLPPLLTAALAPPGSLAGTAFALLPLLASAVLLTLGSVVVFPFEMDTIVTLAQNRAVATHYGLYNTICGLGIAAGTLGVGAVLDLSRSAGLSWLTWVVLAAAGAVSALAVAQLGRTGHLQAKTAARLN